MGLEIRVDRSNERPTGRTGCLTIRAFAATPILVSTLFVGVVSAAEIPFASPLQITLDADGATFVIAVDMDGDGDVDALTSGRETDSIVWHENDGSDPPGWTARLIQQHDGEIAAIILETITGANGQPSIRRNEAETQARIDHDNVLPAHLGQVISGATAHNAGADDDYIGFGLHHNLQLVNNQPSTRSGAGPPEFRLCAGPQKR